MENINILAKTSGFNFIGWKSYNQIKKKAMEQEFSWSGLIISLSIAFFVVLASAQILSTVYQSMEKARQEKNLVNQNIYRLESKELMNPQTSGALEKFFSQPTSLA
ncbi:MAG: hypothetical protein PHZ04_05595 [Patescibacteria group bacterium]|nr:hypothetical protein [Patescibacteria group bacterium]MDD5554072.1 hypothetical protein [Patescibacteria group bacterium]